ncbi:TetR/AcrR family transcriptional regulator [Oceanimonas sp. MB9]|uniref:TetR/AcrR family transcriptional regulator n=1 Tax=Oceanimonas sp. MB9 TaxID=2588453 RepID=UPI0013F6106D|nr:TetR/AcrR family transcriptional regulator [Oceanimonas sp. MB9]NHH99311.1 putative HTH-type transcriptional regulator YxaF [Oceanimonas sp. MB9]
MDKRQQLVTTAFDLFYRQGIHAVGINQILQESGIAKKTLYHHFSGKEALVAAVIAYRDSVFLEWLEGRLERRGPGPEGVIEALFTALDDWINDRECMLTAFHGCFFINTCAEYGDPGHELHRQCARHKTAVTEMLTARLLREGLNEASATQLAHTLSLLKEGAIVQAQVQGDKQAALQARALALRLMAT